MEIRDTVLTLCTTVCVGHIGLVLGRYVRRQASGWRKRTGPYPPTRSPLLPMPDPLLPARLRLLPMRSPLLPICRLRYCLRDLRY
eukprot:918358-Rhodomonas_salina.3